MNLQNLLLKYHDQKEKLWDVMLDKVVDTTEYELIRAEWLTLNRIVSDLAICKAERDARYTFNDFEMNFMETVNMFRDNAEVNAEQAGSNFSYMMYTQGYLQALDSIIKAFDHSARQYSMRKEVTLDDLSDQK